MMLRLPKQEQRLPICSSMYFRSVLLSLLRFQTFLIKYIPKYFTIFLLWPRENAIYSLGMLIIYMYECY